MQVGSNMTINNKKEFIYEIDYNNSSKACSPCAEECKKIKEKINNRNLSEIDTNEITQFLKVFDF